MGASLFSFKTIEVKPFERNEIGSDPSFWLIPVEHTVEAYAIKIKAPKPILYAPEFIHILPSVRDELGDLELAIIDGSSKTTRGKTKGHETIEEGLILGQKLKAKKIYFTNIGHKTDTHQNLVKFVKENNNKFDIAFDGLMIKL